MARRVTLVCGPPCAGKSTYVTQPGDALVCLDWYAQVAGSPRQHGHAEPHLQAARAAYAAAVAALPKHDGTAWVIRCAPEAEARARLAEAIGADLVVVLMPPVHVTIARARRDHRSRHVQRVIARWYWRYTPRAGDVVIESVAVASLNTPRPYGG